MDLDKRHQDAPLATCFTRFSHLPIEIQLQIWERALGVSEYVRTEWARPDIITSWPIVSIPQLGESDKPGLIPYPAPPGVPPTLALFPEPYGVPNPTGFGNGIDWNDYEAGMLRDSSQKLGVISSFSTVWGKMTPFLKKPEKPVQDDDPVAYFSVCRASRLQALKHTIIATEQPLLIDRIRNTRPSRFYPVRNGVVLGSVFKDQQSRRCCLLFMIAPNKSNSKLPPCIGRDFRPGIYSHVAARLEDIEHCIFGHRLSLTETPEGLDEKRFGELSWVMWWRPELGMRARRPEANHPFHIPPASILWIYSMVLHHLVAPQVEDWPLFRECLEGEKSWMYHCGEWYFNFVAKGECFLCHRPLIQELRQYFPELLDSNGYLDVVVLLDRKRFENPEPTVVERSYEIYT
ncbi:hypothetical protein F4779DRAFT_542767 [Xylariaceae sp. FL0662B]|nr:hypothetical protein F4779DRAFT_542767 [Xylariaceae sp. FL0662B]